MDTTSSSFLGTWFNTSTPTEILQLIANQPNFDVNVARENGETLLQLAAINNKKNVVDFLLKQKNIDVNKCNNVNASPLHYAYKFEIVKALVDAGANINAVSSRGNTPIMTNKNDSDSISLLVEAGANLDQVNNEGTTVFDIVSSDYHHLLKNPIDALEEKVEKIAFDEFARITINKAKKISNEEKSKLIQSILATY